MYLSIIINILIILTYYLAMDDLNENIAGATASLFLRIVENELDR